MPAIASLEELIAKIKLLEETLYELPQFVRRDGCGGIVNQARAMAKDLGIEYTREFGEAYNRRTWELRLTQLRYLANQLFDATGIDYLKEWSHLLDKPCPSLKKLSPGGQDAA